MLEFLKDWLEWVERGAPEGEPYSRRCGLCPAVQYYDEFHHTNHADELAEMFLDEFDDVDFPFGMSSYVRHQANFTQHTDQVRIDWVLRTIKDLEERK